MLSMILIHVLENSITFIILENGEIQFRYINNFIFFGINLPRNFVIDLAITICVIAFFIEFYMTFKQIKIINDKHENS